MPTFGPEQPNEDEWQRIFSSLELLRVMDFNATDLNYDNTFIRTDTPSVHFDEFEHNDSVPFEEGHYQHTISSIQQLARLANEASSNRNDDPDWSCMNGRYLMWGTDMRYGIIYDWREQEFVTAFNMESDVAEALDEQEISEDEIPVPDSHGNFNEVEFARGEEPIIYFNYNNNSEFRLIKYNIAEKKIEDWIEAQANSGRNSAFRSGPNYEGIWAWSESYHPEYSEYDFALFDVDEWKFVGGHDQDEFENDNWNSSYVVRGYNYWYMYDTSEPGMRKFSREKDGDDVYPEVQTSFSANALTDFWVPAYVGTVDDNYCNLLDDDDEDVEEMRGVGMVGGGDYSFNDYEMVFFSMRPTSDNIDRNMTTGDDRMETTRHLWGPYVSVVDRDTYWLHRATREGQSPNSLFGNNGDSNVEDRDDFMWAIDEKPFGGGQWYGMGRPNGRNIDHGTSIVYDSDEWYFNNGLNTDENREQREIYLHHTLKDDLEDQEVVIYDCDELDFKSERYTWSDEWESYEGTWDLDQLHVIEHRREHNELVFTFTATDDGGNEAVWWLRYDAETREYIDDVFATASWLNGNNIGTSKTDDEFQRFYIWDNSDNKIRYYDDGVSSWIDSWGDGEDGDEVDGSPNPRPVGNDAFAVAKNDGGDLRIYLAEYNRDDHEGNDGGVVVLTASLDFLTRHRSDGNRISYAKYEPDGYVWAGSMHDSEMMKIDPIDEELVASNTIGDNESVWYFPDEYEDAIYKNDNGNRIERYAYDGFPEDTNQHNSTADEPESLVHCGDYLIAQDSNNRLFKIEELWPDIMLSTDLLVDGEYTVLEWQDVSVDADNDDTINAWFVSAPETTFTDSFDISGDFVDEDVGFDSFVSIKMQGDKVDLENNELVRIDGVTVSVNEE